MARPRSLKPAYCFDRSSGRAYVKLDGRKTYLGRHGTQESRDAYDRVVGEWIGQGRPRALALRRADADGVTVTQVVVGFWAFATTRFPAPPFAPGKRPKGELGNYWDALRPLRRLYGPLPAKAFGDEQLEALQTHMAKLGWCMNYINRNTTRIRRVFKWAYKKRLVDAEVTCRLATVELLKLGRPGVRVTEEIAAVPLAYVEAVLPYLSRHVRAMVELQLNSAARPGEICCLRTRDLETTGRVWIYRPPHHKTAHRGHKRTILIGPRGQAALGPFLKTDLSAFVFSPAEAEAERRAVRRAARTTPGDLGNGPGTNRAPEPRRRPAERYSVASYRRAIARACDKADAWAKGGTIIGNDERVIPRWHPHRLRHTAAKFIRGEKGAEASQILLGHKNMKATEIYAERDLDRAMQIMAEVG